MEKKGNNIYVPLELYLLFTYIRRVFFAFHLVANLRRSRLNKFTTA